MKLIFNINKILTFVIFVGFFLSQAIPQTTFPKHTIWKTFFILFIMNFSFFNNNQLIGQGYYKDVFIDGGVGLSFFELPGIDSLGLTYEFINTENNSQQYDVMISNRYDQNGCFLYPDGQPRFRVYYSHGGYSVNHGNSLEEEGRQRVRDFYDNGGSYVGNCAGSALFSSGRDNEELDSYYHIWPGLVRRVPVGPIWVNQRIPVYSPLLSYRNFSNNYSVNEMYFYYSNFAVQDHSYPGNTEILLKYNTPGLEMHNQVSSWAYKRSSETGRGIATGCHQEFAEDGNRLELTEAIFLYALDGLGVYRIKGQLEHGIPWIMNKYTNDNDPLHTRIGDKQYHHFIIDLPDKQDSLRIQLNGQRGFDFHLYLNYNDFAYEQQFIYADTTEGHIKTLVFEEPDSGLYYISVKCASTVDATREENSYLYSGNLQVLDGLEYHIEAEWGSFSGIDARSKKHTETELLQNYPNPFSEFTTIEFITQESVNLRLDIFNMKGQIIRNIFNGYSLPGKNSFIWDGKTENGMMSQSGTYMYQITTKNYIDKKFI
ncbi:FlgD immunoglobulin-like domain containing protein, partial [Bacteroidota bacterium]